METFQSHLVSTIWNPVCTLALKILLKPWPFSFKKDTITAKTASQLNCLLRRQKLRFTLQMKCLVLHFFVWTWDIFSEKFLARKLEWCWEEKDLINQNLRTTLSAYTLSWYTRTWLSTISSATPKPHCYVAFLSIENLRAGDFITTYNYRTLREPADIYQPAIQTTAQKFFS